MKKTLKVIISAYYAGRISLVQAILMLNDIGVKPKEISQIIGIGSGYCRKIIKFHKRRINA